MMPPRRSPLVGILRLARGRSDGIAQFGDTPREFLVSLVPLAAVQAAPVIRLLAQGDFGNALVGLFAAIVGLLAAPVLSHALAQRWGREEDWPRYAVAANWSIWAVLLFAAVVAPVLLLLALLGLSAAAVITVVVLSVGGYVLWLQWFVARHALALAPGRALAFSLLINLGTLLLMAAPQVLGGGDAPP